MKYVRTIVVPVVFMTICIMCFGAEAFTSKKVIGPKILLRHVADNCSGDNCELEIANSPLPGRSRVVRRLEVISALKLANVDPKGIKIPASCKITRQAISISSENISNLARAAVESVIPPGVIIEKLGTLRAMKVPVGDLEIKARWRNLRFFQRRVSIPLEFVSDGVSFKTLQVSATLMLELPMPVAAIDLESGIILKPEHFEIKTVRLTSAPTRIANKPSAVIGRQLMNPMSKGQVFANSDLKGVTVVRRGQALMVETQNGLIHIRARAMAQQDGAVGDRIRVNLFNSSKLLWVRVTAPGYSMVTP